jgi:uncharacterized protein YyaL (SSP411 family)
VGALRAALAVLVLALPASAPIPPALPGAPAFGDALRQRLEQALRAQGADYEPRTRHRNPDGSPTFSNRLLLESSPYLQQHAHNPVSWYPWGDEAFEAAKRLGRPVFVSIGYSTCHWCHVMEEESFDDVATARLLNQEFIAIKVDRELRPDVDAVYMAAVQQLTGRGGWPLNVWLTPDREPFYGGTYFPPKAGRGRPSFRDVLRQLSSMWSAERARVDLAASALRDAVREKIEGTPARTSVEPHPELLRRALARYDALFDDAWGGLGSGQKFPSSLSIPLLLRIHRRSGEARALEMAETTLERMARGGIHDQVGGGFHRYATEPTWLVPHFEKMLYDNARLALAFLEGWQATGRADFAKVVHKTLGYLEREMRSPRGAFYSATDADSRGPDGHMHEGRFFTWTPEEIERAVGEGGAELVRRYFGVTPGGNFEGRSILHVPQPPEAVAAQLEIPVEELEQRISRAEKRLYAVRATRPGPLRDDKILLAWNGLVVSAFARSGLALDEPSYVRQAERTASFLLENLQQDGRLRRAYARGRAEGTAFLDDHAFLIAGLLDLYEAAPDPRWLREAIRVQSLLDRWYRDGKGGGYFTTASDAEQLIAREKPSFDGALPSGDSVALLNLLRLHEATHDAVYLHRAGQVLAAFQPQLEASPTSLAVMLEGVDYMLDSPKQVILVAPETGSDSSDLLARLRGIYLPNRLLVSVREGAELRAHAELVPLVRQKVARAGRPTAYVCEERVCSLPTSDPDVFAEQLRKVHKLELGPDET